MKIIRRITRRYIEDNTNVPTPEFTKGVCAWREWDTDTFIYTEWWLYPFVHVYFWWMNHRWVVEVFLLHRGYLYTLPNEYVQNWKFRWDYKKNPWYIRRHRSKTHL